MDERRATVILARTPGLTAPPLIEAARAAGGLGALAETFGPSGSAPVDGARVDEDLRWLDASGAMAIPCTSPLYPVRLAQTPGAPVVLYVLGDAGLLAAAQVTVVGARRATPTGREIAREMAGALARAGLAVTSGLAIGIDGAAHQGALDESKPTLAICAHGLDRIYPREHRALAERIRGAGALVSGFAPGAPPRRQHFPSRNRILAALGLATLVVEAERGSGSLVTARFAMQQGRPVFAVPGSVRSVLSGGCHELLRCGARMAESASDVLEGIRIPVSNQLVTAPPQAAFPGGAAGATLDKDSEILLDALGFEPVSLNTLVERTGLPASGIASMLLILELAGRVAPQSGGRYSRVC
jgi:DNA processing protein